MEAITIAIICATAFGVVALLSAFIRQLLLSRDKDLNDKAQQRALSQEVFELENLRKEMISPKRFDSHYQVLGSNKDAIQYLDQKIEDILKKKTDLVQRYAETAIKESTAIVNGEQSLERKSICDKLKNEIDIELQFYQKELEQLQKRRDSLWDTHSELKDYLLEQEKKRNSHLDVIYERHSGMLEKIYLRHNQNSENIATKSIDASTETFKAFIMAPITMLMQYFKPSTNISEDKAKGEIGNRGEVSGAEGDINDSKKTDSAADVPQQEPKTQLHPEWSLNN
ncbi:hypothetical protein [Legionella jordanis]|uniref:Uncharacterized protein n=1 Tax=Legionella jordanis TaxID=456 RepID=A0A0W0V8U0_9GAMM|nr:hypothetical protein [Legionella jordanis]KTD16285.1 hypothetical protein Ljor_0591 [Legionella jordanis]RMX04501.1 hypothetical protein EAW55_03445 [Legionella jordanis]RMX21048.1 hypothetical protein EAS68_04900 [Legionella jordanis]VEH12258.1 Uncharacterised protein [Legionella jordanis]HAT8713468.1 hypothetical protein [Legionella jordanis]